MKDFASGGAILVVDVEATSLLTGSKEVVVVLGLSLFYRFLWRQHKQA
jgi:hypothetical protein